MFATPKGNRLHIGLFGRTNVGKSSVLNFLVNQDVAITSAHAGTTTDVVEKVVEWLPLGPVVFLDTAGLDDASELGEKRIERTRRALVRSDVVLLVVEPEQWGLHEEQVLADCKEKKIPVLVLVNKVDRTDLQIPASLLSILKLQSVSYCALSATTGDRESTVRSVKEKILQILPDDLFRTPALVADLLPAGGLAVLVVPIDLQAPKGRLILPQVQTIRDILDHDALTLVVKEREFAHALAVLGKKPDLVVCDSQTVLKVVADTPREVKCTTFSILFARAKGDLNSAARGAAILEKLKPGDAVLMAEGCSHHSLEDDIGKVKIPRWLRQYVGGDLAIDHFCGKDFPSDVSKYRLAIHCGACTLTRREMLARTHLLEQSGVPLTNYGVAIAALQGVARRVLEPFPSALMAYEKAKKEESLK